MSTEEKLVHPWWSAHWSKMATHFRDVLGNRFNQDQHQAIERAWILAEKHHQGQARKGGNAPYIIHPTRVALFLMIGFEVKDPSIIQGALLHDILEDSDLSRGSLEEAFGREVANLVAILTKKKTDDPRNEHIENPYYQGVIHHGPHAVLVKISDKLDNLTDALNHPSLKKRKLYVEEAYGVFLPLARHLGDLDLTRKAESFILETIRQHPTYWKSETPS